jgi:hypothetical protein
MLPDATLMLGTAECPRDERTLMAHVTMGCRDCKKCTNSGIANLGRNSGRTGAAVFSLGMSELVMAATKNCNVCGHKLSLHRAVDYVQPRQAPMAVAAGWYDEPGTGRRRWWDGGRWTIYAEDWRPDGAHVVAEAEITDAVVTTASAADVHERLAGLAALHASGALSDEEFAAAKRSVLGL